MIRRLYIVSLILACCACGPEEVHTPGEAPEAEQGSGGGGDWRPADPYAGRLDGCTSPREREGVDAVNLRRVTAGVTPFLCLERLSAVATGHAAYLAQNEGRAPASPHEETPGQPGFTGATLGDRGDAAGLDRAAFWLSEGVGGGAGADEVVRAHLDTVYHRSHLLTPGGRYLAFAVATAGRAHAVLNSLAWADVRGLAAATWPADGATDVPRAFGAQGETPDPAPDLARPGYPVSVHFPRYVDKETGHEPALAVDDFTLRAAGGDAVPARLLVAGDDPHVAGSDAFLLPEAPLAPGTRYEAHAALRYGRFTLDRSWTFTTAP